LFRAFPSQLEISSIVFLVDSSSPSNNPPHLHSGIRNLKTIHGIVTLRFFLYDNLCKTKVSPKESCSLQRGIARREEAGWCSLTFMQRYVLPLLSLV
jgi:hypothetical protein